MLINEKLKSTPLPLTEKRRRIKNLFIWFDIWVWYLR